MVKAFEKSIQKNAMCIITKICEKGKMTLVNKGKKTGNTDANSAEGNVPPQLSKNCAQIKKLADDRLKQLQYLQSDIENLKKDCYKEKLKVIEYANEDFIRSLLPFLDSFDKAVEMDDNEGLKKLYQQFYQIIQQHGLRKIEAVGKHLDLYYHEVINREKSSKPEGTVLKELQKGYLLNNKVIRVSKVIVSGTTPSIKTKQA